MAVRPQLFPNRHSFGQRFCAGVKTKWGWNYSGSSNLPELKLVLKRTIMIRRLKSEVLKQLPPKLRKIVYLKVPDNGYMQRVRGIFRSIQKLPNQITAEDLQNAGYSSKDLSGGDAKEADDSPLAIWSKWYMNTGIAKVKPITDYILEKLEDENEKVIIFAHHREVIQKI